MILCKNGAYDGCCKKNSRRSYNKDSAKADDLDGTRNLDGNSDSSYDSWEENGYDTNQYNTNPNETKQPLYEARPG